MARLVWTLPDGSDTARWTEDTGDGTQSIQILGPYTVNFDDAGLDTTGVVLHTFDTPTLVISAVTFIPEAWVSGDPIPFEVTAGSDPSSGIAPLWVLPDLQGGEAQASYSKWFGTGAGQNWVLVDAGDVLGADTFGSMVVTAGVATIYALVAVLS